jgi:hypothetical protein
MDNKRKNLIGAIAGVVTFAIVSYSVQKAFFKPFDQQLVEAASTINKTCPIMVDEDTRLDNSVALPGNIFQYNYTLINYEREDLNPDTLRKYLEPGIISTVATNPDLKIFRDHLTTMAYSYNDKNGAFVVKLSITPDMYKEK